MKQRIISTLVISVLVLIIIVMCIGIFGSDDKAAGTTTTIADETVSAVTDTTVAVLPPVTDTTVSVVTTQPVSADVTEKADKDVAATTVTATTAVSVSEENTENKKMPETTKEIIDQYTLLVDKFKQERPAFKKKEFQALPEEYRKFDGAVNIILDIASNYMVSEEDCEELVRGAGAEEILFDMPVHNTDKGCVLTDYDAVSWAKCEDLGDGTYKISFSLKEEINAEPTPADTLVPVSAHGAVMQPMAISDIMVEVDNITKSLPGINLNDFSLAYRDCEFICIYNPETDEVQSITHHIVIDITADLKIFASDINGSARLLNEMFIYDISW